MSLLGGFREDYLVWDGTEPVRLEVARRVAPPLDTDPLLSKGPHPLVAPAARNRVVGVPVAKHRAVTAREKSPSGGVYMGYEARWWIPQAVLPPGVSPKAADVIVRVKDGSRWTALTSQLGKTDNTWMLGTVNLTLALDLRDTVTIERAQITYDAAGVPVKLYPSGPPPNGGEVLYGGLAARVQLVTREIKDERGIRGTEGRYDVTVGQELFWLTVEDRVLLSDGTYLGITGYRHATRIDELPVVEARREI